MRITWGYAWEKQEAKRTEGFAKKWQSWTVGKAMELYYELSEKESGQIKPKVKINQPLN